MRRIILLALIIFMILTSVASAFDVKLRNPTDELAVYQLIWLECDWEGFPRVMTMATGEIQPRQEVNTGANWKPGRWAISWSTKITYLIKITSAKGVLTASPDKPPVFIPGI